MTVLSAEIPRSCLHGCLLSDGNLVLQADLVKETA
jgi:hypothetical protein